MDLLVTSVCSRLLLAFPDKTHHLTKLFTTGSGFCPAYTLPFLLSPGFMSENMFVEDISQTPICKKVNLINNLCNNISILVLERLRGNIYN